MSPRRKQSTKQLGEILNEAVPHVVAEEVQLPANSPVQTPETAETPVKAPNAATEGHDTAETASEAPEPDAATQTGSKTTAEGQELAENNAETLPGEPSVPATQPQPAAETAKPRLSAPVESVTGDAESDSGPAVATEATDTSQRPPPTEPLVPGVGLRFAADVDSTEDGSDTREASQGHDEATPETEIPPVTWRKSTIPFREDQYDEIGRLLAEFRADHGVQLTIAEVVRLGLDKQIAAFQDESLRPGLLLELYEQQLRESQGNENLKHSRSHGLSKYLRQPRS